MEFFYTAGVILPLTTHHSSGKITPETSYYGAGGKTQKLTHDTDGHHGLLIFALFVPVSFVSLLVHDRQSTREEAVRDVSAKWGGEQTISGPVLTVPYRYVIRDDAGKIDWYEFGRKA